MIVFKGHLFSMECTDMCIYSRMTPFMRLKKIMKILPDDLSGGKTDKREPLSF
jgi:hypothetical protein